jgi:hypothetical protein
MAETKNPIIDNRVVSDKTFAIRLKNFIKEVRVHDCASEEEKEYILNVANRLLNYQIATVKDESEKAYLTRLNLLKSPKTKEQLAAELENLVAHLPHHLAIKVIHKKTKKPYMVLRIVKNCTNSVDGQKMVYYSNGEEDFCRELSEFVDKFEW